jgi:hypothetical protein
MTKLARVTISGADDGVDPKELVALSAEFPFVEWGILRPRSAMEGLPRYPNKKWRDELWVTHAPGMRFAAHLCGRLSLDAMAGWNSWCGESSSYACAIQYQRVQLNGFENYILPDLRVAHDYKSISFILQCSSAASLSRAMELAVFKANVTAIYDPSAGQGVRATSMYPEDWLPTIGDPNIGFAGGIGPDNIVEVLESFSHHVRPFWIDMESGVRTEDRFDLNKVRRVLELAAPFIDKEAVL